MWPSCGVAAQGLGTNDLEAAGLHAYFKGQVTFHSRTSAVCCLNAAFGLQTLALWIGEVTYGRQPDQRTVGGQIERIWKALCTSLRTSGVTRHSAVAPAHHEGKDKYCVARSCLHTDLARLLRNG
jgi:hypothetical protein